MEFGKIIVECAVCQTSLEPEDSLLVGLAEQLPEMAAAQIAEKSGWNVVYRDETDPYILCPTCAERKKKAPPPLPSPLECEACAFPEVSVVFNDGTNPEALYVGNHLLATCLRCGYAKIYAPKFSVPRRRTLW